MTARLPLVLLVVSCALIAGAYALAFLPGGAPAWAAWGLALGSAGALSSVMALGATRGGRVRPVALVACVLTFCVVAGAFACALLLPAREGAHAVLWLGLPVRTAIVLYGVGLVPLVFLPLAYAASFDSDTLSEADIQRVRDTARDGGA
jgi:hypothetical protein